VCSKQNMTEVMMDHQPHFQVQPYVHTCIMFKINPISVGFYTWNSKWPFSLSSLEPNAEFGFQLADTETDSKSWGLSET